MPIDEFHQPGEEAQRSGIPAYERVEPSTEPLLEAGLIQTHEGLARVVATGDGLRIVEPVRRPRYRQGV